MPALQIRPTLISAATAVLLIPAPVAAAARSKVAHRTPPVRVRVPAVHQTDLAASGLKVQLALRHRRSQRVRVATALAVAGARPVTVARARTLTLKQGKPRDLRFALTPRGRTAVAGCQAGDVVVTVTSHGFTKRHIKTTALHLDPPACGRFFSPRSFWNTPVAGDAPLDPESGALSAELQREVDAAYNSNAPPTINTTQYAPPIYTVPAGQRLTSVHLDRPANYAPALSAAFAAVPLPENVVPDAGTDSDLVLWQPSTDTLWEFWRLRREHDGWHAKWGGRLERVSRSSGAFTEPNANWGASASSLAVAGGLITPAELRRGRIDHALGLALPTARAGSFSLPAQRTDGLSSCSNAIPEGAHFRLDPSLDINALGLPPPVAALAHAAQDYGIFVRDRAGTVAFFAQNPSSLPADPYAALFGGVAPWDLLRSFPWSHLQLLQMQLQQAPGGSPPSLQDLLSGCR
jgi:hypothetical protein